MEEEKKDEIDEALTLIKSDQSSSESDDDIDENDENVDITAIINSSRRKTKFIGFDQVSEKKEITDEQLDAELS